MNREGITGPRNRPWIDATIGGNPVAATGILNNELYVGVLAWNRQRFIKNPETGTRISRVNPQSAWIRTEVAHLRIVDDALWQAVRERQRGISALYCPNHANTREERAKRLHLTNRPVTLLSGLLVCGCCGGRISMVMTDRYACRNHLRKGICDNGRTIRRDEIEARVLAGLKEKLVSSEAVTEAVRAYAKETNRLNRDRRAQAETDRKALAKIDRAIAGIMAAIEDGLYQPSMKARMNELERDKADILNRLAEAPTDIPDVHPNIANVYRGNVARFTEALNDPEGGRQVAEALRSLIGEIVLTPGPKRGEVHAELRGELMGILAFATDQKPRQNIRFMPPVASCACSIQRDRGCVHLPQAVCRGDGQSYPVIVRTFADTASDQREPVGAKRIAQRGFQGRPILGPYADAAERFGQRFEIRGAELDRQIGQLHAALFQFDQRQLFVDEDDDRDRQLQIPQGRQFAEKHFQPGIADRGDHGALRFGQFAADGDRHGAAHGAKRRGLKKPARPVGLECLADKDAVGAAVGGDDRVARQGLAQFIDDCGRTPGLAEAPFGFQKRAGLSWRTILPDRFCGKAVRQGRQTGGDVADEIEAGLMHMVPVGFQGDLDDPNRIRPWIAPADAHFNGIVAGQDNAV